MATPLDPKLWEKVKREVSAVYKTNSAYRSGAMVRRYKELGGEFKEKTKPNTGLTRWFKEEWRDIGGLSYPVYRPTKRISKETPLLEREIDKANLKQQIAKKQQIKSGVLPAFKPK